MSTQQPYQDGWVGSEGKQLTVVPRARFPFANNPTPDVFSRAYERDWIVYPPLFVPLMARRTSWTNLVTYSEDLTNAAWTKVNGTAAAGVATAPDGNTTMGRLLETVTNGEHSVAQGATMTAVASEVSIFAAGGLTREWIKVSFTDSAATVFSAFFNVLRGYFVGASAGTTARIIPLGAGFFRCVLQFTPAAGAGTLKINISSDGSTISYAGTTTAGVYLWGAQVNAGDSAPYASTTTATRTINVPDRDPADPFAFLVNEDEPQANGSEYEIIRRLFARVPLTQVVPSFIRVNKPSPGNSFPVILGQYVVEQPDVSQASYNAFGRQIVIADSGPDVGVGGGAVLGGTYTISFDGDTTSAIAYNAAAGVVQAALNAIGSVQDRGGCNVSGDYLSGFTITLAAYPVAVVTPVSWSPGGQILSFFDAPNAYGYWQGFTYSGPLPASGNYTITILGQTTGSIANNASSGAVQAALNALSNVAAAGGVTVTRLMYNSDMSGNQSPSNLTYVFANPLFTVDGSSLLPVGSTGTAAKLDQVNNLFPIPPAFGRQQSLQFVGGAVGPRDIQTATPHNIAGTERIYARAGSNLYFLDPTQYTVTGADGIQFTDVSGVIAYTPDTISEVGKAIREGYTPGTVTVRCDRTTTFYLPNYTPGISSAGDIVPPVYQGDPDTMIQLIFGGVAAINYDVGELEAWRGPVLSLTVTTINASSL